MMNEVSSLTRARAGRPTREQAQARHNELLDAALDHFLDKGFELATIEAIAGAVGMTKRTVYAKYPDKVSLFRAALNLAVERYSVTPEQIAETDCGDIEQTLVRIARLRIRQVMTPNGLKLQRILYTESYRFPDIFLIAYERGAMQTVKFLASVLERETKAGRLAVPDAEVAANLFMSMVVSGPVRIIVSGKVFSDEELERRISDAVRLFLNGALRR
ncbi:MAG: TetR/AcrR family transcriptional regulator [Novosphingobium sp.]